MTDNTKTTVQSTVAPNKETTNTNVSQATTAKEVKQVAQPVVNNKQATPVATPSVQAQKVEKVVNKTANQVPPKTTVQVTVAQILSFCSRC